MLQKVVNRIQAIIEEFLVYLVNLAGLVPIHHFRRLVYRLTGVKIGAGSTVHTGAVFYTLGNIEIGQDSIIGEKAVLDGRGGIKIGSHTALASEVMIYTSQHNINDEHFAAFNKPVVIEDYVFIGPRSVLLPGVKIEKGAVVGAGAVVTKDVPAFSVVGGVPAREIAKRALTNPQYKLGRARWFR